MAKTVNCAFCGKELTTGFFSGTAKELHLADGKSVACCDACYERYDMDLQEVKRFRNKVDNYKKVNRIRKLTEKDVFDLYMTYFREREENIARNGQGALPNFTCFFRHDGEGLFNVEEVNLGDIMLTKDMIKLLDRQQKGLDIGYSAGDISQISYCLKDKLGTSTGTFSNAYLFEIRFNDPGVMTYKPTVTYAVVQGAALLPHNARKNAEKTMEATMQAFRIVTGSNLPVNKVKKF